MVVLSLKTQAWSTNIIFTLTLMFAHLCKWSNVFINIFTKVMIEQQWNREKIAMKSNNISTFAILGPLRQLKRFFTYIMHTEKTTVIWLHLQMFGLHRVVYDVIWKSTIFLDKASL